MEKRKLSTKTQERKFANFKYFEEHPGVKSNGIIESLTDTSTFCVKNRLHE